MQALTLPSPLRVLLVLLFFTGVLRAHEASEHRSAAYLFERITEASAHLDYLTIYEFMDATYKKHLSADRFVDALSNAQFKIESLDLLFESRVGNMQICTYRAVYWIGDVKRAQFGSMFIFEGRLQNFPVVATGLPEFAVLPAFSESGVYGK